MAGMSTSLVISAARVAISALVVSATAIDEERTTCAATMMDTRAGYWKLSEPREQEQGKQQNHQVHIFLVMKQGKCVCPLS